MEKKCFRFANSRWSDDICKETVILNIYYALKYPLYASFDDLNDLNAWKL